MPHPTLDLIDGDTPVVIFNTGRILRYFRRYDLTEPLPGSKLKDRRVVTVQDAAKLNGSCLFVMLNPSVADEHRSDPTLRRCYDFALQWGFRWLDVVNVFPLVSTKRAALKRHPSVTDPQTILDNSEYIMRAALRADRVVLAWGADGTINDAGPALGRVLEKLGIQAPYVFKLTEKGQPWHPLYMAADAPLTRITDLPEWKEMLWP